jgi:UDP-N-acetylglucosamine--N-acetylmuramyl-(pentapeptide) pyrophosphoryl-undecaprenol N-acetylglucosamine transferase
MNAAQPPLVLMMAGGTGGHVYPALAVATELLSRGYRVEWVGTRRGLEHRVVPAAGIALHCLPVRGVRGKNLLHTLLGVLLLAVASLQALWLVLRLAPRCVVGMGGYVAGPAGVAAWLWRRPLVIHEQNAVAGTTNRLLAPLAKRVLAGFPAAFRDDVTCEVLGNPVRRELVEAGRAAGYDYDGQRPLRLLVLGGSLGARPINRAIPAAVSALNEGGATPAVEVWHQAGEAHADEVRASYGDLSAAGVRVAPFIDDMAEAYLWADLVLCRAGALTVSELAITGRPAILVPLPHAIDDHQTANARALSDRGAAILLPQGDMDAGSLSRLVGSCLEHPERLAAMAAAATEAAMPDATDRVCDRCEALIHGR